MWQQDRQVSLRRLKGVLSASGVNSIISEAQQERHAKGPIISASTIQCHVRYAGLDTVLTGSEFAPEPADGQRKEALGASALPARAPRGARWLCARRACGQDPSSGPRRVARRIAVSPRPRQRNIALLCLCTLILATFNSAHPQQQDQVPQPSSVRTLDLQRSSQQHQQQALATTVKHVKPEPSRAAPRGRPEESQREELIQLLAELYAQIEIRNTLFSWGLDNLLKEGKGGSQEELRELKMRVGADNDSLLDWLRSQQSRFGSLKNASFVLLEEAPKSAINICPDGPKILVAPNVSNIWYCYTHDQWVRKLWADIHLSPIHYPVILLNILVFLFGTTGNIFVCLSVYRNHQLRSVTNYFIVNLAFADFLVILICLPATILWDLSLTWFFGTLPCKLIMFLQDVSISVSVLTLTAISVDRYYAICHPLKYKSGLKKAKRMIVVIWLVSLLTMAPDLIYLRAQLAEEFSEAGLDTVLYSDCNYNWSERSSHLFQSVKTILLYLLPFILMLCAHHKIMRTLREASREIPSPPVLAPPGSRQWEEGTREQTTEMSGCGDLHDEDRARATQDSPLQPELPAAASAPGGQATPLEACIKTLRFELPPTDPPVRVSVELGRNRTQTRSPAANLARASISSYQISDGTLAQKRASTPQTTPLTLTMHNKSKLESRRAAAKMLTTIVILFGICYLPVHLINLFRQEIPHTDVTYTIAMLAHSFCYLNSAINPIIYNHMNKLFRAEFRKFLSCLDCRPKHKNASRFVGSHSLSRLVRRCSQRGEMNASVPLESLTLANGGSIKFGDLRSNSTVS